MMLFIHDLEGKRQMRQLLTRVTDQNQSDTDRICDKLELAFNPNDPDDPRFTLGKVAWGVIERSVPTQACSPTLVHMKLPIAFDSWRAEVMPMITPRELILNRRSSGTCVLGRVSYQADSVGGTLIRTLPVFDGTDSSRSHSNHPTDSRVTRSPKIEYSLTSQYPQEWPAFAQN
jgi:hypothetical protein